MAFGSADEPRDCGLAAFTADDTLLAREESLFSLPSLGRSGREIRLSYLLRGVEESRSLPKRKWGIRPLALYHSFDVITGRSTWVTLKGNGLIRSRIGDATRYAPAFQPDTARDVREAFSTTLEIHLVVLNWCDENWRWNINDLEEEIRRIFRKAKTAKIDADPHFSNIPDDITQTITRSGSTYTKPPMSRSSAMIGRLKSGAGNVQRFMKRVSFGRSKPQSLDQEKADSGRGGIFSSRRTAVAPEQNVKPRLDNLVALDIFPFDEMRRLQDIAEKIREALLVVRLNATVISQIASYYGNLLESESIQGVSIIKKECRSDVARFLSRTQTIKMNLNTRKEQLESILRPASDGRTLGRPTFSTP